MRIALLELLPQQKSGTGVRGRAIARHLRAGGHHVDVIAPPPGFVQSFQKSRLSLLTRLNRRFRRRKALPHLWDALAKHFRPRLAAGRYEVIIARGQEVGYSLLTADARLKVLDMANVAFLEQYYAAAPDMAVVSETFEKECQVLRAADYVLSPDDGLSQVLPGVFPGVPGLPSRLVTARLGCEESAAVAEASSAPRMVYAGSYYYLQDPLLLARLAKVCPIPVHCYGPRDPNQSFLPTRLEYQGFAPDESFLASYQLGLITVARDWLRQYSPSTKFPYYFAHGLPVLFPSWMAEGHRYPECALAYDEEAFADKVRYALEPARWRRMSQAAIRAAGELTWPRVLAPLDGLLQR